MYILVLGFWQLYVLPLFVSISQNAALLNLCQYQIWHDRVMITGHNNIQERATMITRHLNIVD